MTDMNNRDGRSVSRPIEGRDDLLLDKVAQGATACRFEKNDPIYVPGNGARWVYLLRSGHVKISRLNPDGDEILLDVLGPGELFGECAILQDEDHNEIAHALDSVLVEKIRKEDFQTLLEQDTALNFLVMKHFGQRVRKIEQRFGDILFVDARRRIARFLLRYAEDFGLPNECGGITVRPYLTHRDIAVLTGSVRQTVTTTLNELRSAGALEFSRQGFTIPDLERLRSMA